MKKFTAPLTLALACVAYGLVVVCEFYFAARAQGATNVCNTDCLLQKMDALNQKTQALEHTVGDLELQINKSIKTGQTVTLHTQRGHEGMPYLLWSEWRSRRLRFLECQLFPRHFVDHQLARRVDLKA
jgi:hypothetical protein